jgi:hypothetical protein
MGRGSQPITTERGATTVRRADLLAQAIALVRHVTGKDDHDAQAALALRGTSDASNVEAALADILADAWTSDPIAVARRLLPTTLLDRPRRQHWRAAAPESLVSADDWRELVSQRGMQLARWHERDWAQWLNGLIRTRSEIEPDQPHHRRGPAGAGDVASYARTLFYAGR